MATIGDRDARGEVRRERIAPLATLPLFFNLGGERAIMAGGTDAAAWKAELLAATGADVEVYAPAEDLSGEMRALLEAPRETGRLIHHDRRWGADIFGGAAIAVADAETDGEAAAFACAARAAGVPVNVIDKPAFCQFRFGTVVNRSPVVVGIATDGAAPILGQAVRRRIETLLPPSLSHWAGLAARVRAAVIERLAPGAPRRAFWERFSDLALSGRAPAQDEDATALLRDVEAGRSGSAGGRVTLVGAGPGEAELLTLKAVRALQAADVILFDDLVSDDILELARREARRMLVGKRAGRTSCRQEDINETMVALARAGKNVVRLKSGDVSIFGRAGEEIAELKREGIPVSIVPGITAASALAVAFGVSLTHREHSHSLRLVTAHSRKGALSEDVDWPALAQAHATTIFYMGGRMAERIRDRLIAEGMAPHTPVAVAANLSRPDETREAGRLTELPEIVAKIGLDRPILIGVGGVFGEAAMLAETGEPSEARFG
ncbi:siroheme synthase CysG [Aureimonas mangrovi]|uniref:siroheme synthase CysG n=1 Tax=Aureimonas mangrovi TaxID=2758041 RepID=UPI00163D9291|nr:siroheme synthase CysG [Aureimonas mangrovi]